MLVEWSVIVLSSYFHTSLNLVASCSWLNLAKFCGTVALTNTVYLIIINMLIYAEGASDSLRLVDFAFGLVNSVLNLRDGQINFFVGNSL